MQRPEWNSLLEIESVLRQDILEYRMSNLEGIKSDSPSDEIARKYYYELGRLHGISDLWDRREEYLKALEEPETKDSLEFPNNPYRRK